MFSRQLLLALLGLAAARAAPNTTANGVFSTVARQASFNGTTLLLKGVSNTTLWLSYAPTVASGTLTQAAYAGPASPLQTNGSWLNGTGQAALYGDINGTASVAALLLKGAALQGANTLAFTYTALDPSMTNATLPLSGGAANGALAAAASNGTDAGGARMLAAAQMATRTLANVTLVVDAVDIPSLVRVGQSKLIRVGLGGDFGYLPYDWRG